MGITSRRADRHISEWQAILSQSFSPHRAQWPSRLFHHTPIENAVVILSQEILLSRIDSDGCRRRDVAGVAVVQNRSRAHHFGRLYFRPRTPTQYWIEGIRKAGDYWNNDPQAHAPTLVMLTFDARAILTQENVRFSTGNMQSDEASDGEDDDFFDTIDFAKVYHYGPIGGDRAIINRRCAEVLVPSPMAITGSLKSIVCRSKAERQTLLYEMGADCARVWSKDIHVSEDRNFFEKEHTFVDTVTLQQDGVVFKLHPTRQVVDVEFEVWNSSGKRIKHIIRKGLPVVPPNGSFWLVSVKLTIGLYRVRITIEDCRAFEAKLFFGDGLF